MRRYSSDPLYVYLSIIDVIDTGEPRRTSRINNIPSAVHVAGRIFQSSSYFFFSFLSFFLSFLSFSFFLHSSLRWLELWSHAVLCNPITHLLQIAINLHGCRLPGARKLNCSTKCVVKFYRSQWIKSWRANGGKETSEENRNEIKFCAVEVVTRLGTFVYQLFCGDIDDYAENYRDVSRTIR